MIATRRLALVPATVELTRAALAGAEVLEASLGAAVPPTWPPEYLDAAALEFTLARLTADPAQAGWRLYFVVLHAGVSGRILVGTAGYKGPPSDGTLEIGYAIVGDHQRRGYAVEAVRGLIAHAFADPTVRRVIPETLPELAPSIGVLARCGFRLIGEGSEPGVIRFELGRADHERLSTDA